MSFVGSHIFIEGNNNVDSLVNLGFTISDSVYFNSLPLFLEHIL